MTREEFDAKHKASQHKHVTLDGKRSFMEWDDKAGTVLVVEPTTPELAAIAMRDLRPGDKLPYYTCSCDCIDGPCEHGPEIWVVSSVVVDVDGIDRVTVRFTNDQLEHGTWGSTLVVAS